MERGIGQPTSTTSPASTPTTPLGARAEAVSPPIAAPTPDKIIPVAAQTTTVAQADSWDEETYTCRANDTFKGISQQFYHSDRYDRALLLFNRNHPLAADWIRQDPPTPAAGQPVYIPPAHILEKRYAAAIPGLSSLPAAADGPKQPAGYRQYKVRPNGEMLLEIARRTLGASERWSDIHQLNKRYDPQKPIPPGTILWLPADARVETGDQP